MNQYFLYTSFKHPLATQTLVLAHPNTHHPHLPPPVPLPHNLLIIPCLHYCSSIQERMLGKATFGSLIRLNLWSTCLIGLIPTKVRNQQHVKRINTSSPNYTTGSESLACYSGFCTRINRSTLACTQVHDQAKAMKAN